MRHLFCGAALTALVAAGLPAAAQTSGTEPQKPAASTAGEPLAAAPGTKPQRPARRTIQEAMAPKRATTEPGDDMAETLNRQELHRLQEDAQTAGESAPRQ